MTYPKKCVVDTNVPITANLSIAPATIPDEQVDCVIHCVDILHRIISNGGLVLDAGGEIFDEYKKHLSIAGSPGIGNSFMKWVHDHQWNFPIEDRVSITKENETYAEFPQDQQLKTCDKSDMKFVAVANAHKDNPSIIQATDAKWWKWSRILKKNNIHVLFMDDALAQKGCRKKNRCGNKDCNKC